jgi:hypothetical protein
MIPFDLLADRRHSIQAAGVIGSHYCIKKTDVNSSINDMHNSFCSNQPATDVYHYHFIIKFDSTRNSIMNINLIC